MEFRSIWRIITLMNQDGQSLVAIETIDQWRAFVAAFDDVNLPKSAWTL
jgi:hypothetical protein